MPCPIVSPSFLRPERSRHGHFIAENFPSSAQLFGVAFGLQGRCCTGLIRPPEVGDLDTFACGIGVGELRPGRFLNTLIASLAASAVDGAYLTSLNVLQGRGP